MHAQDARAHAVNRRNPCIIDLQRLLGHAFRTQGALHARLDFSCGLFRERDGHDLFYAVEKRASVRSRTLHKGPGDTLREGERLPAACARRNHQGLVERRDARELTRLESAEVHDELPLPFRT